MPQANQSNATKPDKGLNTKKYLIAVFVFLMVCCLAMLGWFHHTATSNSDPAVESRGHAGDGVTATDKGGKR